MTARSRRSADFERVLRTCNRVRSAHFAVHYLPDVDGFANKSELLSSQMELSTGSAPISPNAVDDIAGADAGPGLPGAHHSHHWLGAVVPKRHARRAVTRSLLKRQIRSAFRRHRASLPCGLWVVRLRSQFGRDEFPSAASEALRQAAAEELAALLFRAGRLTPPP